MKKSIIALGAVALCGSLLADVSSANVVGYSTFNKKDGENLQTYGCPFVYVGAQTAKFKLYDMKVIGTLSTSTKKSNYIQMIDSSELTMDLARAYYWDYNKAPSWTTEKGCWCYKQSDEKTGQEKDGVVPQDTEFPAGTGFLCRFGTDNKGLGLQFNGQVYKPQAAEIDDKGYITIAKPNDSDAFFFFANPFPVEISLADLYVGGTLSTSTKKSNYIQYVKQDELTMDLVRAYYWDYNKTPAAGGDKGCWCFKQDGPDGQAKDAEITDAASRKIKPGEGFLCRFGTTGKGICLKVKVPESIKSL